MQRWEYKYLYRSRGIVASNNGYLDCGPWNPPLPFEDFQRLGEEGWELVAVKTTSDYGGKIDSEFHGAEYGSGALTAVMVSGKVVSGVTTSETFYFKRPKL